MNLDNFFKPKSIAIIGASRNPKKVGHVLFRNLIDSNYHGKIFLVNKNAEHILNYKSYKSVSQIKEKIDLAIISIPAEFVLEVIDDCNKKNIKDILMITAGFSEIGNKDLEIKLKEKIQKNKIRMLGPNCLGVFDGNSRFDSLFLPRYRLKRPQGGNISFVCQSGAVGSAILDIATEQGHKFAKFVSYGNATTLDESDIIEYLGNDKETKVICVYLEAIKDGKKFINITKKISKNKPIIAIKGGMTEEGNKATLSHTGSLAGNAQVYLGAFKQAGIIHAESLHDMLNYASIFEKSIKPKGNKVQVITNGGGYGIISTDSISLNNHLKMAELSKETYKELKKQMPTLVTISNPMDLVGDATTERYKLALDYCINDNNINIILLIALYQTPLVTTDLVDVITEVNDLKKKPIIVVSTGGEFTEILSEALEKNGVVTFNFPEEAVKSIGALVEYYNKK